MTRMLRTIRLVTLTCVAVLANGLFMIGTLPGDEPAGDVATEGALIPEEPRDGPEESWSELPDDAEQPDLQRLPRRLQDLQTRMQQALRAGQFEEIERLGREARELFQRLEPEERAATLGPEVGFHRRNWHVQAAIEHLRAAGWDEQADQLTRRAERFLQDQTAMPEWDPYGGVSPHPTSETERVERVMRSLQSQAEELRRRLDEIRPEDPRAAAEDFFDAP